MIYNPDRNRVILSVPARDPLHAYLTDIAKASGMTAAEVARSILREVMRDDMQAEAAE